MRNSLPIVTGVDHGLVVAVHRGVDRVFVFDLGFLVFVVMAAVANFLSSAAIAVRVLTTAVAATELVLELVQARAVAATSATGITA